MIVVDHCEVIYPHDASQTLNASRCLILNKVPDEQALSLRLYKPIVAFGRASCCSTGRTESACADAWDVVAAGAFKFG